MRRRNCVAAYGPSAVRRLASTRVRNKLQFVLATTLLAIAFAAVGPSSQALADACAPMSGGGFYCTWNEPNLAPATPRYFQAAVTLRNWHYAAVIDGHGGAVTEKCVHIQRGSDAYTEQVACGSGVRDGYTNAYMRPGYLFTRHGASGARNITGDGAHG